MSERLRFADLHQDRLNPVLAEVLNNPEFRYAAERRKQFTPQGLRTLDLAFVSLYRRANEEVKDAALHGDEQVLGPVRADYLRIADYYNAVREFRVIERPQDIMLGDDYERNNVVLHLESGDIISSPQVVDELYERGVRSVGPLYSHDNLLGGGAAGSGDRGLTALGKRVIDRMLDKGMVVDIAHANRRTANDILDRVGDYKKVIASHTGIGQQQRFVDVDIIRQIAQRGGVVGFTPSKPFFPSLDAYLSAVRETSERIGNVDVLAVGTDFGGLDAVHLFEDFDEIGKLGYLAERLSVDEKFTDEEVSKIMFGNVERIVKEL